MKVTLINPPNWIAKNTLSYYGPVPPLGLAYISSYLESKGIAVQVVDAIGESKSDFKAVDLPGFELLEHGLSIEEIEERIPEDCDIVGITNMYLHEYLIIEKLVKYIKSKRPELKIVLGGENASSFSDYILRNLSQVDYIVIGEGEETFYNLILALRNGSDLENIAGLAFVENDLIFHTEKRARIMAVDELPAPSWEKFSLKSYWDNRFSGGVNRGRSIPMIMSRGCPYRCQFCSSVNMWTTRYNTRSPENVVDEIESYIKKYDIQNIDFNDLTSFINKKWIREFFSLIKKRNINVSWQLPQGSRIEAFDEEITKLLYESGCRNFAFAPESGSDYILKKIQKRLKLNKLIDAMKMSLKAGIIVNNNIIIGLPGERFRDILLSYLFVLKTAFWGAHGVGIMIFTPYPGSPLYKELVNKGHIKFDKQYFLSTLLRASASSKSYNEGYKNWHLIIIQMIMVFSFFGLQYTLRPWRLYKRVRNIFISNEEDVMDQFISVKIKQFKSYLKKV